MYLNNLIEFVENIHKNDSSGHDFFHINRVVNLAKFIAEKEGGNLELIELAAWLHDVGDYKLHNGIDRTEELVSEFFNQNQSILNLKNEVLTIIKQVSYKGGFNEKAATLEAKIVQDADRLDAIGAIGIGRTFAYGGSVGNLMYDSSWLFNDSQSELEYKSKNKTTLHHFNDKLLKLKDLMNTKTAKDLAKKRHQFMLNFVSEFLEEWNFK